jgi:hypothetical protein
MGTVPITHYCIRRDDLHAADLDQVAVLRAAAALELLGDPTDVVRGLEAGPARIGPDLLPAPPVRRVPELARLPEPLITCGRL